MVLVPVTGGIDRCRDVFSCSGRVTCPDAAVAVLAVTA
jgi:hypothetical protein